MLQVEALSPKYVLEQDSRESSEIAARHFFELIRQKSSTAWYEVDPASIQAFRVSVDFRACEPVGPVSSDVNPSFLVVHPLESVIITL